MASTEIYLHNDQIKQEESIIFEDALETIEIAPQIPPSSKVIDKIATTEIYLYNMNDPSLMEQVEERIIFEDVLDIEMGPQMPPSSKIIDKLADYIAKIGIMLIFLYVYLNFVK